jgi:pimeloyl-ACP methyl ester carboxylesterase
MIHGMFAGPWCWENHRRVLERRGHRCVTPALPYHDMDPRGLPDPRLGTTSLLDYAAALERQVRQLGTQPVLMGHSMGGLLAQLLAARGLARALVLLAPAAPSGIISLSPSVLRSFWSIQTRWGFWRRPMRQTFDEAIFSMLHLLPDSERRPTYDKFVFESGRAALEIGYWPLDHLHASRVEESSVTCPVLVIAGAQDRITPASVVRQVAGKYRARAAYREFANHAHWLLAEPGWQEVAEDVGDWLGSKCLVGAGS